jgi:DNA invertase Pin-like site-specific DNA recombinase
MKTNPVKQGKVIQKGYYLIPKIHLLSKHQRWKKQAEKLKLSREAKNRLNWIIYYETKGENNVSKTVRYFGIGRSTFYKWFNRFDGINLKTFKIKSSQNSQRKRIFNHQRFQGY